MFRSIKESNFNAKNGSKLSHLITARAEGADPSPPLIVSLTVKRPSFLRLQLLREEMKGTVFQPLPFKRKTPYQVQTKSTKPFGAIYETQLPGQIVITF